MSLKMPSRRIVSSASALSSRIPLSFLVPCIQRRTLFGWGKNEATPPQTPKNFLTEEFLKRKPAAAPKLERGGLADSSIFEDEAIAGAKSTEATKPGTELSQGVGGKQMARNPYSMAAALDPDPRARKRWERKMVIREIQKRGRLTKAQQLKREERTLLLRSHDFRTSVKKLVPLAKQITGKTVEEAIIQMRFSSKKVAKDVKAHLEAAKNEAIVRRGMGIGLGKEGFQRVNIMTNKGKRVTVEDPTTLYVEQAWCGKGLYTTTPDYRARGQVHIMKNRTTSLSLVLKEEKTRIRLHNERETKEANKKVWTQLPNRPITAQRQYYSW